MTYSLTKIINTPGIRLFSVDKLYRPSSGASLFAQYGKKNITEALNDAKTRVTFLEVPVLKGVPVNQSLKKTATDSHVERYYKDILSAFK